MRLLPLVLVLSCAEAPLEPVTAPGLDPTFVEPTEPSVADPTEPPADPTAPSDVVDCTPIADDPGFELCDETPDTCAGVFTDGSGCEAFCAAAGLECVASYGGEPGCQVEPDAPLPCAGSTGHQSDWCECGPVPEPGDCATPAGSTTAELGLGDAAFGQRHNWVVTCREYAYTARGAEHEACDPSFVPDGSRHGTATFTFTGVPRGTWRVEVGGRHTENRNPAGALFLVNGQGVVVDQTDPSGDLVWDDLGVFCLEGTVEVVLDSSVNGGSDSVFGARLVPVF